MVNKIGGAYFSFDGLFTDVEIRPDLGKENLVLKRNKNTDQMSRFEVYDLENFAKEIEQDEFDRKLKLVSKFVAE